MAQFIYFYAECRYAECCNPECCNAGCRGTTIEEFICYYQKTLKAIFAQKKNIGLV